MQNVCNVSQNGQKRRRTAPIDSDSDNELIPTPVVWPRFLVIKPNNKETNSFSTTSPFAIHKALHGIAGEMKSIKKLGNGDLLVECRTKSHSDNLLKCSLFINFPVTVSPHQSLNTSRGIIRHREFKYCSDEEIQTNLSTQNVTEVKRISVKRDGALCQTNTFIITFNSPTLPSNIKIAWFNVPVEPYIPNPLRCFKCQRFGHHKDRCRCEPRCAQCGEVNHEADSCNNPLKCPNCQGNHLASSKECPKWILEKEVQTVKYTRHISYPEARKLVENRMPSGKTYAAAAKADVQLPSTSLSSVSVLNRSVTSSTQTDPNAFPLYPPFFSIGARLVHTPTNLVQN